jgi:uncharacterized protein affecting Mg2+/Co2+ transport
MPEFAEQIVAAVDKARVVKGDGVITTIPIMTPTERRAFVMGVLIAVTVAKLNDDGIIAVMNEMGITPDETRHCALAILYAHTHRDS